MARKEHPRQTATSATPEFSRPLRVSGLNRARDHMVDETASGAECQDVARLLELVGLSKFRISGRLDPVSPGGWRFEGTLGATVSQPCVVTLRPVRTRIDVPVSRVFLPGAHAAAETAAEVEIDPDAEEIDPLPETLDLGAIAIEELALALPPYPRAEGVPETDLSARPPGAAPIEEKENPFAALSALRGKIGNDGE